jgi:alkylation response protein AidB-like acyl-CoA dehydrogenase
MDTRLDEEQVEIVRQARRFCENECPVDYVRAMIEDERGFSDTMWSKMAAMGWLKMRIPVQYGGLGMRSMELALILEEMGRALFTGPFFPTVLLAAELIVEAGDDSQKEYYLPRIAAGEIRGTMALHEPDGGADPGYIQMQARSNGDGFILKGTKLFVPDAHVADFLVCAARTKSANERSQGITLFLIDRRVKGLFVSLLPTMDGTRKSCAVEFKNVPVKADGILGVVHEGWKPLQRVLQRAQVGLCADCVGGAQRAMEIAVDYAGTRVQYGRPIGSFQVIKHRCTQMLQQVESSRSIMYWSAWAQDYAVPEKAQLAASVAKVYCSEASKDVSTWAIQVLGSIGFCWEHDIHLYLKRARANEVALGDPEYHRERVAQLLEDLDVYISQDLNIYVKF